MKRFTLALCTTAIILLGCDQSNPPITDQPTPAQVAQRVANRIVEDTRFTFRTELMEIDQDGSFQIDVSDGIAIRPGSVWIAQSIIRADSTVTESRTIRLGISTDPGRVVVKLNGQPIVESNSNEEFYLDYPDYGYFRYTYQPEVTIEPGDNDLTIEFENSTQNGRIAFGLRDFQSGLRPAGLSVVSPIPGDAGLHYPIIYLGPLTREEAAEVAPFNPVNATHAWKLPQQHLVSTIDDRLSYSDWRYFTGTFLDAMFRVQDAFPDQDYSAYINEHLNFFLDNRDAIVVERSRLNLRESAFGHYFRYRLLDDVGMQSVPYLERYSRSLSGSMEAHPDDSSLVLAIIDHIENHSDRLPDGTFARLTPDSMTVWADDLFMGSVILSRSASVFGRPELIDEVANQIILFDQHLKDQESGLYWHGWFNTTQTPSSSKWARANGWTMIAKMFALEVIPDNHPKRNEVLRIFADHAMALKNVQSADGRYHQILDNPDTYLETSATAMFTAAFATGVNNGWLDRDEFDDSIRKGWAAVTKQIDENGNVEGIVRGTPIMFSDQAYHEHPPRRNDPRGLGAILYCTVAMDAYLK